MNNDNNPQPQVAQPISNNTQQAANKKPQKLLVAAIVVLVLAVSGFFIWHNRNNQTDQSFSYTYHGTSPYLVPGSSGGKGIVFNLPSAFGPAASNEDTNTLRGFEQLVPDKKLNSRVVSARLMVSSVDFIKVTQNLLNALNDAFAGPVTSDAYVNSARNVQGFARGAFKQPNTKITYGKAKAFTNPGIKENAWEMDFNLSYTNNILPPQQGELLYLYGKNAKYYFLITAVKDNWQSNSQFFQAVTDSIRIDR